MALEQKLSVYEAHLLPYVPVLPIIWSSLPSNTGDALDILAADVNALIGGVNFQGAYNATTNTPNLTTPAAGAVDKGYMYKVTTAGTAFFGETLEVGDTLFANIDDPAVLSDWTVVQANLTVPVYSRVYFVSDEVGDDTNDGLSEFSQFATLNKAITVANAATPAFGDKILIRITDSKTYTFGAGAVTLAEFVNIVAPEAHVVGDSGTPTVLSGSFNQIEFATIDGTDLEIRQTSGTGFGGFIIMAPSIFNIDGLFTMLSANGAIAGDSITINSNSCTGSGTFLETDIGESYVFTLLASIDYSSASDVPFLKCSGGEIHANITELGGDNGGAGDAIGVEALSGGKVFMVNGCNSVDIAYSADGVGSEIHVTGETLTTISETTGGLVYRNTPSEGVYYPNLPATGGLALSDVFKISKAGVAERATLTQLQALIGGSGTTATAKVANYTAVAGDFVLMTTGATDKTVTLPLAASNTDAIIEVKKVDAGAGNVIIDGNGAETIDGATTQTILTQYTSLTLHCDGTTWWIK